MIEITEAIPHPMEQQGNSRINSRVALIVAISATFMALCNVKDGNIVQAMQLSQANTIDTWSYFEAKSIKLVVTEKNLELLKVQNTPQSQYLIKKYEEEVLRYSKEKAEIKRQAEGFQKAYNELNRYDDQLDMTDAFLTISIAMLGIASLTQKRWLLYFAGAMSLLGIILGAAAFLHINLHSDIVSKILG